MIDLENKVKNLNGPQPNTYFAAKVLAQIKYREARNKIFIWKLASVFSLVIGSFFSFYYFQKTAHYSLDYQQAPVHKSMMLVLQSTPQDSKITYVTLEIDNGMYFELSKLELRQKKEITIAIDSESLKLGRLPFVFSANISGKKNIKIKYLDADFNELYVETHFVEFLDLNKTNNNKTGEST